MNSSYIQIHVLRMKRDHKILKILTSCAHQSTEMSSGGRSEPVEPDSEVMPVHSSGSVNMNKGIQNV